MAAMARTVTRMPTIVVDSSAFMSVHPRLRSATGQARHRRRYG
jgi:hypothetical protein